MPTEEFHYAEIGKEELDKLGHWYRPFMAVYILRGNDLEDFTINHQRLMAFAKQEGIDLENGDIHTEPDLIREILGP